MIDRATLDWQSSVPLYRQVADEISRKIQQGELRGGSRLPATRELALQLGLNRTTISAAYELLSARGLVAGHVGRGSFVAEQPPVRAQTPHAGLDWKRILSSPPDLSFRAMAGAFQAEISFASSSPARRSFPLEPFRTAALDLLAGPELEEVLQLGTPYGYGPLRRYLSGQAMAGGWGRPDDDVLVTSGCQQALDLLARLFAAPGQVVMMEDPIYPGQAQAFRRAGATLQMLPVDGEGVLDCDAVEQAFRLRKPALVIVTPTFQNPTGRTQPAPARVGLIALARRYGVPLAENDVYSDLRYLGEPVPKLRQLDERGDVILLGSFSKIAFPGLRVGWVLAPRPVIARLAEAKETSDLHGDQLSQAVLLRFAETGQLAEHVKRSREAGAARLAAALEAADRYLPHGTRFTRPAGGMNLWMELPGGLAASRLLEECLARGVSFLPGHYFALSDTGRERAHGHALRLSFGGLEPDVIQKGIRIMGEAVRELLAAGNASERYGEPAMALV